jgi:antimicrobial peptide system SdpA family protein
MKHKHILPITFILVASFWGIITFGSAVSALPFNPLSGSKVEAMKYSLVLPQGWAFFTRNPREEHYYLYKMQDGELQSMLHTNSSYKNAFGFTREVRRRGVEMGGIIGRLNHKTWFKCPDGILQDCITQNDSIETIRSMNLAHHPAYCGELWLEKKPIVPWAWSRSEKPVNMPSEYLKINVSCE